MVNYIQLPHIHQQSGRQLTQVPASHESRKPLKTSWSYAQDPNQILICFQIAKPTNQVSLASNAGHQENDVLRRIDAKIHKTGHNDVSMAESTVKCIGFPTCSVGY